MMKPLIWAVVVVLVVAGVTLIWRRAPATSPIVETPIEEGAGYTAQIEARIDEGGSAFGVKLVPLEVLEDSRCAADVTCIQAGTVKLRTLLVQEGEENVEAIFTLGKTLEAELAHITLEDVQPVPVSTLQIEAGEYRFSFLVEKQ